MILYGASGHAKVINSALDSQNEEVKCFFDDDISIEFFLGKNVFSPYDETKFIEEKLIISIGNNKIRKKISEKVKHNFGIAIHKSAIIDKSVQIGLGSVVLHNSVLQPGTIINRHVVVNTSSSIDHDCVIKDYAHISPGAILCGNVTIGDGTQVGAGAIVIQNISIGKWATIGAGSVIIRDVPDYAVVVGNPGNIIKYNTPLSLE
jgi:sugar O-acyltransferase (sialic acid O-acetyltransferase NeuD family)